MYNSTQLKAWTIPVPSENHISYQLEASTQGIQFLPISHRESNSKPFLQGIANGMFSHLMGQKHRQRFAEKKGKRNEDDPARYMDLSQVGIHLYTSVHIDLHLYTCTPVYLYTCTTEHMYTCTHVHLYNCTLEPMYTCTPVHLFPSTPVHM